MGMHRAHQGDGFEESLRRINSNYPPTELIHCAYIPEGMTSIMQVGNIGVKKTLKTLIRKYHFDHIRERAAHNVIDKCVTTAEQHHHWPESAGKPESIRKR